MADAINITLSGVNLSPLSSYQEPDNPFCDASVGFSMSVTANTNDIGEYTKDPNSSRVYTSSDLGFEIDITQYNQAMPFGMFKNIYAPLTTELTVEDIPILLIKLVPTMDSYVRENYPNMNYGADGLVVSSPATNGEIIEAYYQFSFVDDKGKNFLSTIQKSDLLGAYFESYNPSRQPDGGTFSLVELDKGSWIENDVNWWDKPTTTGKELGTIAASALEAYNNSSSLIDAIFPGGTGVAEELNFAVLNTAAGSTATYVGGSKEGPYKPHLVLKMIDTVLYNAGHRYAHIPFSITLKVSNNPAYLPFTLNVFSRNVNVDFPTVGAVTKWLMLGKTFVPCVSEIPFSVKPAIFNADLQSFKGAVTASLIHAKTFQPAISELPFKLTPRIFKQGERLSAFGVTTKSFGSTFTPAVAEIPFTLTPRVPQDAVLSSVFGVTAEMIHAATYVPAVGELPFTVTARKHAEDGVPTAFGVTTSLTLARATTPAISELPFTLMVQGRTFLPFNLNVMGHAAIPFSLNSQPVSDIPFEIRCVYSPQIAFYINPRVREASVLPFTMTVRVRNAKTLPFSINSNLTTNYISIV